MMTGSVEKILIIRLSAIGDIVMASVLVPAIKALFPKAKIDWLAEPVAATMLQGHPQLNDVVVWQRGQWRAYAKNKQYLRLFKAFWAFRSQLKRGQYDLVLDTQGLLKSGIWAWFSGAPKRIGLGSKEGSQYLMTEVLARDSSAVISSEYRGLIAHLSRSEKFVDAHCKMSLTFHDDPIAVSEFQAQLAELKGERVTEPDPDSPESLETFSQRSQTRDYVVLCPYTTRPQKHWFDHHWITLSRQIALHLGIPCVILGGPEDAQSGESLANQCERTLSFAGKASLQGSSRIIAGARYLVGVDTGITHMGIMHGVPTIAIFGSTCPYLDAPGAKVLYLNKSCSPCRRKPTCDGRFDCLLEITPEQVVTAMKSLNSAQ